MDCRETQDLLTAFHDGELPGPDRARVEDHLRACPGCRALLADLARADAAASVPDPGPGYWDRFNARVAERVEREAGGPKAAVLQAKRGWVRQQLRYLVPAVAAAALVVVVVRFGPLNPASPPPLPPTAVERAAPGYPGERLAKAEREPPAPKKAEGAGTVRRVPEKSARFAGERHDDAAREERDRLADRSLREAKEGAARDRAEVPSVGGVASPPPAPTYRAAPPVPPPFAAAEPQFADGDGSASGVKMAKDSSSAAPAAAALGKSMEKGAPAPLASATTPARSSSPCELARTLAERKRWRDAEAAQRACLAKDRTAPAQEKGLVFLAELLDRQERFADADAVLTEVHRQFPDSRPLGLYRQQRPMVQRHPTEVPALLR